MRVLMLLLLPVIVLFSSCWGDEQVADKVIEGPYFLFIEEPHLVFDTLIQGYEGFEKTISFQNAGTEKLVIAGIKKPDEGYCKPEWDKKSYNPGEGGKITIKCMVRGKKMVDEVYFLKSNSISVTDTFSLKGFVSGPPRIEMEIVK